MMTNKPADCIRIEGTLGRYAGAVNGMYEATKELSGDMPVYTKVGGPDVCLEYNASVKQWQIKLTADKGNDRSYACCTVPAKCFPQDCPVGHWEVFVGDQQVPQPADTTISVVTKEEAETHRIALERDSVRMVKGSHNVRITGATGTAAGLINGVYKPTEELSDNVTVYVKLEGGDMWLKYHARLHQWQVKTTDDKGSDRCHAYCTVSHKCFPQECPVGHWEGAVDDQQISMSAVIITSEVSDRYILVTTDTP